MLRPGRLKLFLFSALISLVCALIIVFVFFSDEILSTRDSEPGTIVGEVETIKRFNSEIEIDKNGIVTVTENLSINVLGSLIKRGFVRRFPTDEYQNLEVEPLLVMRGVDTLPLDLKKDDKGFLINVLTEEDKALPIANIPFLLKYRLKNTIKRDNSREILRINPFGSWPITISKPLVLVHLPPFLLSKSVKTRCIFKSMNLEEPKKMDVITSNNGEVEVGESEAIISQPSDSTLSLAFPNDIKPLVSVTLELSWPEGFVKNMK